MSSQTFDASSSDASLPLPVLVVDDDAISAVTTLAALAAGGYPGTDEANGDAALQRVRATLVRLVVSELYVGCAEGPCVVTILKRDRARLPRVPVLIYTRHEREADVERALATGCDALVLKSADAGVLLREVARLDGIPLTPQRN